MILEGLIAFYIVAAILLIANMLRVRRNRKEKEKMSRFERAIYFDSSSLLREIDIELIEGRDVIIIDEDDPLLDKYRKFKEGK